MCRLSEAQRVTGQDKGVQGVSQQHAPPVRMVLQEGLVQRPDGKEVAVERIDVTQDEGSMVRPGAESPPEHHRAQSRKEHHVAPEPEQGSGLAGGLHRPGVEAEVGERETFASAAEGRECSLQLVGWSTDTVSGLDRPRTLDDMPNHGGEYHAGSCVDWQARSSSMAAS